MNHRRESPLDDSIADFSFEHLNNLNHVSGRKKYKNVEIRVLLLNNNKLKNLNNFNVFLKTFFTNPGTIEWIDLSANLLTTLSDSFETLTNLHSLHIHNNNIINIEELVKLQECPSLSHLTCFGNPLAEVPYFKKRVRDILPQLAYLDFAPVIGSIDRLEVEREVENDDNDDDLTSVSAWLDREDSIPVTVSVIKSNTRPSIKKIASGRKSVKEGVSFQDIINRPSKIQLPSDVSSVSVASSKSVSYYICGECNKTVDANSSKNDKCSINGKCSKSTSGTCDECSEKIRDSSRWKRYQSLSRSSTSVESRNKSSKERRKSKAKILTPSLSQLSRASVAESALSEVMESSEDTASGKNKHT